MNKIPDNAFAKFLINFILFQCKFIFKTFSAYSLQLKYDQHVIYSFHRQVPLGKNLLISSSFPPLYINRTPFFIKSRKYSKRKRESYFMKIKNPTRES